MIAVSARPRGDRLETIVCVARDRSTGLVHGTYTHSYVEGTDSDHETALDRWTAELRQRMGPEVDLDVSTHPAAVLNADWSTHLHRPGKPSDHRLSESTSISRP